MIVYLLLGITLFIAGLSIRLIARSLAGGIKHTWPVLLLGITLAGFIYLYGAWVYLSVYTQYLFVVFLLVFIVRAIRGRRRRQAGPARSSNIVWPVLASLPFILLVILYFTGTGGPYNTISLKLPFKQGNYFVLQGGKGLPANLFHYNSRRAVYAIDLVRLNDKGQRSSHIFSKELNDYFIFGDTVYSPCDGTIERAIDDNPDNIPPERKRGPHNLNAVLIEAEQAYIFMGHLKYQAVFVKAGDRVKTGTPLGLAGNSGFSIEPHLHIQAHEKKDNGKAWYEQKQLFIQFDGKEYLLFQTIKTIASRVR